MTKIKNLLLLRGLIRESKHWGEFPNQIQAHYPFVNVHTIDLPGAGNRNHLIAPTHIKDYIPQMRDDYLKIKNEHKNGNWYLLSYSMGGMISMKWLSQYPEDFESGAIINTSAKNFATPFKRLGLKAIKKIPSLLLTQNIQKREKIILNLITEIKKPSPEIIESWTKIQKDHPVSTINSFRQLIAASRFTTPREIKTPLLFIASKNDSLAHYTTSIRLAEYFNCKYKVHEKAGHDIALDDPEWLIRVLGNFFNFND